MTSPGKKEDLLYVGRFCLYLCPETAEGLALYTRASDSDMVVV